MSSAKKPTLVNSLRKARSWHKVLGLGLAVLLLVSAVTGLLLGWKKQSTWLQPATHKGSAGQLADWRPVDELASAATLAFVAHVGADVDATIDRMDVRPSKNSVKVRFEHEDYEVQVDGISAEILHIGKRNADWIERIHDGSIVSDTFKLVSMNVLSIGLVFLIATGTWLYYGPKRYRASRRGR